MKKICINFFLIIVMLHTLQTINANFTLITQLYNENDPARLEEYRYCLLENLKNPYIKEIHVFYDTSKDDDENKLLSLLQSYKVNIHYVSNRVTFGMLFNMANREHAGKQIIICNGDIFFNETLRRVSDFHQVNTVLALTRWNLTVDGKFVLEERGSVNFGGLYSASHDAWIFCSPLNYTKKEIAEIEMGSYGCDGKLTFFLRMSEIKVHNPARSIQACHYHLSELRTYKKTPLPWDSIVFLPVVALP